MAAPPGTSAGMHKLTNVEAQRIMAILEESCAKLDLLSHVWRGRVARRDFEKKKKGGKGGKGGKGKKKK